MMILGRDAERVARAETKQRARTRQNSIEESAARHVNEEMHPAKKIVYKARREVEMQQIKNRKSKSTLIETFLKAETTKKTMQSGQW
eukprot:2301574-Pleurochrysis_carterae.AAC.1